MTGPDDENSDAANYIMGVQTLETLGTCVISFEYSIIENCWLDNSKRDSVGKLRIRSIWI